MLQSYSFPWSGRHPINQDALLLLGEFSWRDPVRATNGILSLFLQHDTRWQSSSSWMSGRELDMDDITAHFMPIVDLATGNVVGYEALARRIRNGVVELPEAWLGDVLSDPEKSRRLGAGMLLEAANALHRLPDGIYVAVNFEIGDLRVGNYFDVRQQADLDALAHRIVIEISERAAMTADAVEAAAFARRLGARIALDDVGAGSARLMALVDLEPAFIKLDASITKRLEEAKIAKLVRFLCDGASSFGARIICEGIETPIIADLARASGAASGQGYLFGKPGPLPD